jgi:hypothetical protein
MNFGGPNSAEAHLPLAPLQLWWLALDTEIKSLKKAARAEEVKPSPQGKASLPRPPPLAFPPYTSRPADVRLRRKQPLGL